MRSGLDSRIALVTLLLVQKRSGARPEDADPFPKGGLSGNDETKKLLEKKGFKVDEVGEQAFFFEKLVVLRITDGKIKS